MKKLNSKIFFYLLAIVMVTFSTSCSENDDPGNIKVSFDFYNDGEPVVYDTMVYTNEAGNLYLINDIRFFISRLTIYKNGEAVKLSNDKNIHYINNHIESTQVWNVNEDIKEGVYDSIAFTFGLNNEDNKSYIFPNPPENEMSWPVILGGGYHYMKLEGKWLNLDNENEGYAFHLGIGQIYDDNKEIIDYVDNSFRIVLENSEIEILKGATKEFTIRMNIEEWFKNPNIHDWNVSRGNIMANQEAMSNLCKNGQTVFELVQ